MLPAVPTGALASVSRWRMCVTELKIGIFTDIPVRLNQKLYFTHTVISTNRLIPPMEAIDLPRHQIIQNLMAPHTERVADVAIKHWEQIATKIISIVGEDGFNSLYSRSVFLAQLTFPWIATSALLTPADQRFAELKMSFEGQTPAQVRKANNLLLTTFTDIFASLIGEELTTSILRLAWDSNAPDSAGKEFGNE